MIPGDVASRLQTQVTTDTSLRPAAPVRDVSDRLSDLVAGQRVMAQIQAILPNGTYRALINQRDVTLALPFSARSGDSLELLVTESDGKKTLAVVSHNGAQTGKAAGESVSATLSRTGQLIAQLLGNGKNAEDHASALALNGNKPIASAPPQTANDILPSLKQALSESGMFYESHQAKWVDGQFMKEALLREPQGKLSPSATQFPQGQSGPTPSSPLPLLPQPPTLSVAQDAEASHGSSTTSLPTATSNPLVSPQTQGIVQQQLEALATQNFAWQGQIWPGQEMRWEIEEEGKRHGQNGDDAATRWQTRLSLRLPALGGITAQIQLHGEQLLMSISVDNAQAKELMQGDIESLRQQMSEAGLVVASLAIGEEAPQS
jgi:hypothetical protein